VGTVSLFIRRDKFRKAAIVLVKSFRELRLLRAFPGILARTSRISFCNEYLCQRELPESYRKVVVSRLKSVKYGWAK
jgi:hypothetical protein